MAIIVGTLWAAPGKGNLFLLAIGEQDGIEKLATIIRIQAQHRKWQQGTCPLKDRKDGFWAAMKQWETFGPASGNVRQRQGVQIAAKHIAATMRDQVRFQKARTMIVPLGKGANGDLVFEQCSGFRRRDPMSRWPMLRAQEPLGGSDTEGK